MKTLQFVALAALAMSSTAAYAKSATCFTSDDGRYACNFKALDRQGSFEIKARGKPTFTLWVDEPGRGSAFINLGDGNVSLPGEYVRQDDDPACWQSSDTEARICAW